MKILILDLHYENSKSFETNIRKVIQSKYSASIEFKRLFDPKFSYENLYNYDGIILSGISKKSTWKKQKFVEFSEKLDDLIENKETLFFGICGSYELLGKIFGYKIVEIDVPEIGNTEVMITGLGIEDPLFNGLDKIINPFQYHKRAVSGVEEEKILAQNDKCIQAVKFDKNVYGVQFHPELSKKYNGQEIIENFIKIVESKKY